MLASEESRETAATRRLALVDRLATILKGVPGYMRETPTQEVNQALRDLFQEVVVNDVETVQLVLRLGWLRGPGGRRITN